MGDLVTAVVCTRDRPDSLQQAVRALLQSEGVEFELIVVDQSSGPESERAMAALSAGPRIRYVRSASRGKGAALNEGLRLAATACTVFTDDDCEAPPDWMAGMARALEEQPTAAIVFSNVRSAPHDRSLGYIPAYERRRSRLVRSIAATCAGHGLGAGMAVRREVVLDMGGFDETFGPGARFPSGDDWDITHRLLLRGWHAYECATVFTVHSGFRTFAQGRAHARRDWYAIGAVCAKPLRAGYWSSIVLPAWVFTSEALWPPVLDLLKLRKPRGFTRIAAFLEGFAQGMRTPVDRQKLLFVPRA
ncbi:MAG TPA: glycosyltransferase family 2 protein [Myxococcales bacterium]|jgi:GT2 family glycosyltransferase|nr:glycosyltransferase family 2 protein [Myxococcales bacterium]